MKKLLALLLVAVMLFSFAACGGDDNNDDAGNAGTNEATGLSEALLPAPEIKKDFEIDANFKIGIICLHDENSTYDLNFINAVLAVKKALGLTDDQVILKRNIPESNDCYEAAKDLAVKGCKVVFANSFGHETYMIQAAKEYKDVEFCHATGTMAHTENLENYHNAFASIYEGRYLAGIAAGMKLNELKAAGKLKGDKPVMGYVGAFTYAEVISGYTSFYLGAKSVCPDVTMKVQFTGSWYDPDEEKSAAQALIAAKCDLISQHADSLGAPTACEDAGIPNVSYNGSTYESGENTFIISSAINWQPYFYYIIKAANTGSKIDADWTGTIATGSVVLSGLNLDVAAEGTADAIKAAVEDLKTGKVKVFDTAKDNFILKDGQKITSYMADVDTDAAFTPDTEVIANGYFNESSFRSAPYFDIQIDGITLVNSKF